MQKKVLSTIFDPDAEARQLEAETKKQKRLEGFTTIKQTSMIVEGTNSQTCLRSRRRRSRALRPEPPCAPSEKRNQLEIEVRAVGI